MDSFSYHSEQVHSLFKNGKGQTRRNIVSIRNGKGTKAVETYSMDGKHLKRKELPLTDKELQCIAKNKFVPGLFKDCIHPPSLSTSRPKRTVRRRRNK